MSIISTFIRTTEYSADGTPNTYTHIIHPDAAPATLTENDPVVQGLKGLDDGLQVGV